MARVMKAPALGQGGCAALAPHSARVRPWATRAFLLLAARVASRPIVSLAPLDVRASPAVTRISRGSCAPTPALAGPGRGGSWGLCRAGCLWPCVRWDLTWGRVVRWRAQSYLLRRLPPFRGYPSRAAPFLRRRCGPVALGGAPALLALKGAQRNLRCHATQPVGFWWPGFVTDGHRRSAGAGLPAPIRRAQTRGKAERFRRMWALTPAARGTLRKWIVVRRGV